MSDELERLRRLLETDAPRSNVEAALDAMLAEHRVALSHARAEALEDAAQIGDKYECEAMRHKQPQVLVDVCGNIAGDIRALIATPASATIPVERVREMFREALEYSWLRPAQATALARILEVDLDATQKALACVKCKCPVESEDIALMPETSTCRRCHNKAPPEDEP